MTEFNHNTNVSSPLTPELMRRILAQYRLRRDGFHGLSHWGRVRDNGLRLARQTGADPQLVELFAVFHDACRHNDDTDMHHGKRGAQLAERLRRENLFILDDERFDQLFVACRDHTLGHTEADVNIQTCWDADRLDLLRVFITPNAKKLCTEAARDPELMERCNDRAKRRVVPRLVRDEWLPLHPD